MATDPANDKAAAVKVATFAFLPLLMTRHHCPRENARDCALPTGSHRVHLSIEVRLPVQFHAGAPHQGRIRYLEPILKNIARDLILLLPTGRLTAATSVVGAGASAVCA